MKMSLVLALVASVAATTVPALAKPSSAIVAAVADKGRPEADTKREQYLAVTRDEDFATVLQVTRGAGALGEETFWYGRNEPGNQNLHRWVAALVGGDDAPCVPVHRPGA